MGSSDEINKIIKILQDKGATEKCPACGCETFTLMDGHFRKDYTTIEDQSPHPLEALGIRKGLPVRRSLHYIVLVCDNCGYLRQHATKFLKPTAK